MTLLISWTVVMLAISKYKIYIQFMRNVIINVQKQRPTLIPELRAKNGVNKDKRHAQKQQPTTVWRFGAEEPPLSQIAKVFCGRAIVSVHLRPVSTPSLRSVGHSPQVHGTQAQFYLATSPYLYVRRNTNWPRQLVPSWHSQMQNTKIAF